VELHFNFLIKRFKVGVKNVPNPRDYFVHIDSEDFSPFLIVYFRWEIKAPGPILLFSCPHFREGVSLHPSSYWVACSYQSARSNKIYRNVDQRLLCTWGFACPFFFGQNFCPRGFGCGFIQYLKSYCPWVSKSATCVAWSPQCIWHRITKLKRNVVLHVYIHIGVCL
jgi:hypothetical protein